MECGWDFIEGVGGRTIGINKNNALSCVIIVTHTDMLSELIITAISLDDVTELSSDFSSGSVISLT